jgi:hypothetical protein
VTSTGTLHPTGFGHFYAALRILTQLHKDKTLTGHNLNNLTDYECDPVGYDLKRPKGEEGFAHFIQNMNHDRIERFYKF